MEARVPEGGVASCLMGCVGCPDADECQGGTRVLRLGRCRVDVAIRQLMMIDSLDMTETDRGVIAEACAASDASRIIITHGTDTMVETARTLARHAIGKTIVLTGAMVPYAFGSSDGLFNLGSALSFAQTLPAGVYVAMNGRAFLWNEVQKNRETGVFETLNATR